MNSISASWTLKDSLTEGHLSDIESAFATSMTTSSCFWVLSEFSTACYSLVGQHSIEPSPTCVEDVFSKISLNHVLDIQVFTTDYLIVSGYGMTEFVQEVSPLIKDFEMLPSQYDSGFLPIMTAFDSPRVSPLQSRQSLLSIQVESRISNTLPFIICQELFESDINTNLVIVRMLDFWKVYLTSEYDVPLSSLILLDCHRLDFAFWDAMEFDWNTSDFADSQPLIAEEFESALWVCDARYPAFESWVSCFYFDAFFSHFYPVEEVVVCFAESVSNILERLRIDGRVSLWVANLHVSQEHIHIVPACHEVFFGEFEQGIMCFLEYGELLVQSIDLYPTGIDTVFKHTQFCHRGVTID
jgi:hypothetical protein